ncbi:MAG TPA: PH domain-containing protein [Candidatus Dojkabacteria bacterium]|jgi:hypothetical protein
MPQIPPNEMAQIVGRHRNLTASLDVQPVHVHFETQNRGEVVFVKARAHPLVNFGWVFNTALLVFIPPIILAAAAFFDFEIDSIFSPLAEFFLIGSFYAFVFTNAFFNFLDWYYDVYLVTNERIINIQFDPLKRHRITEAKLIDIEFVEETTIGLFQSLFGYGDVKASTAAKTNLFIFKAVPDPAWFRDTIMDAARFLRGGRRGNDRF